jgi:hypothetical protein
MAALTITDDGDRAIITATGSLQQHSTHRLKAQLRSLIDTGIRYVLLDLTEVTESMLRAMQVELRTLGGLLATEGADKWLDIDLTSASLVELFSLYQRLRDQLPSVKSV